MAILVDENTSVLVQGITGREAATFTKSMIDYGTQVVAGVTPGKGGQQVHGVPVFNTVRKAVDATAPNVAVVSVPPAFAKDAVLEAVDAGIKLVNVFTERVPRGDVVQMIAFGQWMKLGGPIRLGLRQFCRAVVECVRRRAVSSLSTESGRAPRSTSGAIP